MKLKWTVGEVPTGKYRCFEKRGWPWATYPDGNMAAHIYCKDAYEPRLVKEGKHGPLVVAIADYNVVDVKTQGKFVWRKFQPQAITLNEAKEFAKGVIEARPEIHPKSPDVK